MEEQSVNRQFPYFKHYFNAMQDSKLVRLLHREGMEGIGIFWSILEQLGSVKGCKYKRDYEDLAYMFHVDEDKIRRVVENYDLFVIEDDYFYNRSFSAQMEDLLESRKKRAAAGSKGGKKKAENERKRSNATEKDSIATEELKQCSSNALANKYNILPTPKGVANREDKILSSKEAKFISSPSSSFEGEEEVEKEKKEEEKKEEFLEEKNYIYDDRVTDDVFIKIVREFMYKGARKPTEEAKILIDKMAPTWIYEKDGRDFTGREEKATGFCFIPRERKYIPISRLITSQIRAVNEFLEILQEAGIKELCLLDSYRGFTYDESECQYTIHLTSADVARYIDKNYASQMYAALHRRNPVDFKCEYRIVQEQ